MPDDRDWDHELAKIDKIMGAEPAPTPATRNAAGDTPPVARKTASPAATRPGGGLRVWSMALLGPLGAAGLLFWPYVHGCGPMLWVYLVGVSAVLGAALVTLRSAWVHHRGVAMSVGVVTLIVALAMVGAEVLPRVGYAAIASHWSCTT